MAKKAHKQQASALDEVRRHVRIFIDLGRVASESTDEDGFLDQVVVQVARAVEINHVKVLRYRRREADLLVAAGFGWKEGIVRSASLSADLRSPPGRSFQTGQPVVIKNFQAQEKRRYRAGDAQRALDHIASRINAISLAHDQLAPHEKGQFLKVSDYLRALCLSIKQQTEGIEIEVEADELELSIERAVPLGLILNEIATNSIKHAFGPDGGGRISVKLVAGVGYGEARLSVADNGRGIKQHNPTGTGLKLIVALARQIGWIVDQESSNQGTRTWLTFPVG